MEARCLSAIKKMILSRLARAKFFILLVSLVLSPAFCAGGAPAMMTHIVVRLSGTGISNNSFTAKPKVYWRAGTRYCRVDEEPDPENGIHGRTVVNEPDAWLIDLADHTAKHILDKGPTFNCRLPIFANDPEALKSKLGELEFGRELDFFQSNGAEQIDGPRLEFKANYYKVTIGDSVLTLVERMDIHAPIFIGLVRGEKTTEVHYLLWDDRERFKPDLFAVPTDVKVQEVQ